STSPASTPRTLSSTPPLSWSASAKARMPVASATRATAKETRRGGMRSMSLRPITVWASSFSLRMGQVRPSDQARCASATANSAMNIRDDMNMLMGGDFLGAGPAGREPPAASTDRAEEADDEEQLKGDMQPDDAEVDVLCVAAPG